MIRLAYAVGALSLAVSAASPAIAKKFVPPPMPAGYDDPGPQPADTIGQIVAGLKAKLKDPYSVRDLVVCQPDQSDPHPPFDKYDHWEPAKWSVLLSLNAKNSYGGYTGRQNAFASFRGGKLVDLDVGNLDTSTALGADLQDASEKVLAKCERVPDERVQRMMKEG